MSNSTAFAMRSSNSSHCNAASCSLLNLENSSGCDNSTLSDLNIRDGDSISVEKGKIDLAVKMPHSKKEIKIIVDPKNDTVDEIRNQIFDETGLPREYQQRIIYDKELMDNL